MTTPYTDRDDAARAARLSLLEAVRKSEGGAAATWGLSRTHEDQTGEVIASALRSLHGSSDPGPAASMLEEAQKRSAAEDLCLLLARARQSARDEWLETALRIAPHNAPAWLARAVARKNPRDAIEDLAHAIDIWPAFPEALAARGLARAALGEKERAEADLRAALSEAPATWHARACVQAALDEVRKP